MKNLNIYLTPDLKHVIKHYFPHFLFALITIAYTAWSHHCFHAEVMKLHQEMQANGKMHRETNGRIDGAHARLDYLWHIFTNK